MPRYEIVEHSLMDSQVEIAIFHDGVRAQEIAYLLNAAADDLKQSLSSACARAAGREWPSEVQIMRELQEFVTQYPKFSRDATAEDVIFASDIHEAAQNIRALASQPSPSEWRSMESAPKDGTQVLLLSELRTYQIAWHANGGWSYGGGEWLDQKIPAYWQPLPSPPSPELRKGDEP